MLRHPRIAVKRRYSVLSVLRPVSSVRWVESPNRPLPQQKPCTGERLYDRPRTLLSQDPYTQYVRPFARPEREGADDYNVLPTQAVTHLPNNT